MNLKQFKKLDDKAIEYFMLLISLGLSLSACSLSQRNIDTSETKPINVITETIKEEGINDMIINIKTSNEEFKAELQNSETTKALLQQFPLVITMQDMNGLEKYSYLSQSLPRNAQTIGKINAGDIFLYGSDCLVIFYASFTSSYQYTYIGHVENVTRVKNALDQGNGELTLSRLE